MKRSCCLLQVLCYQRFVKKTSLKCYKTIKCSPSPQLLEKPLELFALPVTAGCSVASQELRSPLFGDKAPAHAHKEKAGHEHEHEHEHENGHADIHAHYQLSCEKPELLKLLTLAEFFKRFPATQKIQVQLIGPDGQKGADLAPASAELKL